MKNKGMNRILVLITVFSLFFLSSRSQTCSIPS